MAKTYLLSGDIGGTKTLLQLSAADDEHAPLLQRYYASAAYTSLPEMLEVFLGEAGVSEIRSACFAVAGPVEGRVVRLTNLPWQVDEGELASRFRIQQVSLLNDFEAAGLGLAELRDEDLQALQTVEKRAAGTRLLVGAGTGLGVAWLTEQEGVYRVHPSEAGHMDFAPVDATQDLLLQYLRHRHEHVSYERIVSGPGLLAIFDFMRDSGIAEPSAKMLAAMEKEEAAAVITRFGQSGDEAIARMTVDLFLSVYGAFVGNMALAVLPQGGIYIGGGIAAKIKAQMRGGEFMRALLRKGRQANMLAKLPVNIILDVNVGLIGASKYARTALSVK